MGSIEAVGAGAIGPGRARRARITVGTSVISVPPPDGAWGSIKVTNLTAGTWVAVAINEDPSNESTSPPTQSSHYGVGCDVLGSTSELIGVIGPITTVRLLASAAGTSVVVDFIA